MHAHGISHRDLKLENLVFGRAGAISTVSIVDFGLAKAARARERMEGVTGTLWCDPLFPRALPPLRSRACGALAPGISWDVAREVAPHAAMASGAPPTHGVVRA